MINDPHVARHFDHTSKEYDFIPTWTDRRLRPFTVTALTSYRICFCGKENQILRS